MKTRTASGYFKRFISVILMMSVLLIMTPVWEKMVDSADITDEVMTIAENGYEGDGSSETPFKIYTVEAFKELLGGDKNLDKHFLLMESIDLKGKESDQWTPIGSKTSDSFKFTGSFDGGRNTISGLYINTNNSGYYGLFGYVGKNATISNLTVEGSITCTVTSDIVDNTYVGGIVAFNDSSRLEKCTNNATVTGTSNCVGGVVGSNKSGTIDTCKNYGAVTDNGTETKDNGGNYVGGVVGKSEGGFVQNCENHNTVTGVSSVGGVVGGSSNSCEISGCKNFSKVTGTSNGVGGVVGYNKSSKVDNCTNEDVAEVVGKGNNYTGGVVGNNESGTVKNSYNNGTVTGSTGASSVGGIVGQNNKADAKVENCENNGTVNGDGKTVGGVAGINSSGTITGCTNNKNAAVIGNSDVVGGVAGSNSGTIDGCDNYAAVSGGGSVGGVVGKNEAAGKVQNKCHNEGNVTGNGNNVGGVAGDNSGTVEVSFNVGIVKGTKNNVGGVVGNNGSGKVQICYNTGKVDGNDNVGGVAGNNLAPMENCYNTGNVTGKSNYAGGIAGNNSSSINNAYNIGAVSGANTCGAALGKNTGSISNSFYFPRNPSMPAIGDESTGSTTATSSADADEFATEGTFIDVGWGFSNSDEWMMGQADVTGENVRPILRKIQEHPLYPLPRTPADVTHTVTFEYEDGNTPSETRTYDDGAAFGTNCPDTPTRPGYIFDGWYTERNGGTKIDPDYTITEDQTLYAHWKAETSESDPSESDSSESNSSESNSSNGNSSNNNSGNGNSSNGNPNNGNSGNGNQSSDPNDNTHQPSTGDDTPQRPSTGTPNPPASNSGTLSDSTSSGSSGPGNVNVGTESSGNAPEVSISEGSSGKLKEEVINEHLTDEEKSAFESGDDIDIILRVEDAEDTVSDEDRQAAEDALADTGYKEGTYLDVELIKRVNGEETGKIPEINSPISVTIEVPEELRSSNRDFVIIRIFNGKAEILEDIDNDPDTITIMTDKFCTYAIAYLDTNPSNPDTGAPITVIALAVMISAAAVTIRRKNIIE